MNIHDLWRAGRSTTGRAWLTNPVRNILFIVARPYLAEIIQALSGSVRHDELDRIDVTMKNQRDELDRIDATMRNQRDDVTSSLRLSAAIKEELQRFGVLMDGLRKDQLAWAHRLGSLEDSVDSGRCEAEDLRRELTEQLLQVRNTDQHIAALAQQVESLKQRSEAFQMPAGMATLMRDRPLAIAGTSLVLNSGPYGRFLLRQPDLVSDHILAGSFWDSHLKPVIERARRPDGSAIDAGAYLGFHSVYMSRFFRFVHAFEPQVEIYRMLCANLLLNNCRNVRAVNGGLYDIPGRLQLAGSASQEIPLPVADGAVDYDRIGNAAALTFQLTSESDSKGVCAQAIDQLGLTDLAFIKVDTQGSDLHVLKGARATIQRCRPVITAEYERELARGHGDVLEDYYRYFDEMAYEVQELDNRSDGKQIDLLATPR